MLKFIGTVVNGVVVFENGHLPPEGMVVDVTPKTLDLQVADPPEKPFGFLLKYAGIITDMPADFADQHDHYLHGTPKR